MNVKSSKGDFMFVNDNEFHVNNPPLRTDITALSISFNLAMNVASKGSVNNSINQINVQENSTFDPDLIEHAGMKASLESDLIVTKAEKLAEATQAYRHMKKYIGDGNLDSTNSAREGQILIINRFIKESLGLDHQWYQDMLDLLAITHYQHKWCDLTTEKLSMQLSVQCKDQGDLLRSIKVNYDCIINNLLKCYDIVLQALNSGTNELASTKSEILSSDEVWGAKMKILEDRIAKMRHEMDHVEAKAAEKRDKLQAESNQQLQKMGSTLKTLNGMFKNIVSDVDGLKQVDLQSENIRLTQKNLELTREVEDYRPMVEAANRFKENMIANTDENTELKAKIKELEEELTKRDILVKGLVETQRDLEEEKNKLKREVEKWEAGAEQDAQGVTVRPAVSQSTLCARCNGDLDEAADSREADNLRNKIQCYSYRLLLPNNNGHYPMRTNVWLRQCMRSILYSKAMEVITAGSLAATTTIRFPEFVYTWYDPPRKTLDKLRKDDRTKYIDEANENRWGIYYGLKTLARENAEARIFWSFLDETYGEDYLSFFMYCYTLLMHVSGKVLMRQFGVNIPQGSSFENLEAACAAEAETNAKKAEEFRKGIEDLEKSSPTKPRTLDEDEESAISEPEGLHQVPMGAQETLWVPIIHAKATTDLVLYRSPKELSTRIWEHVRKLSVQAEGRLPYLEDYGDDYDEGVIDMFVWIKVLMQNYRQEQINRKAAIKLMFTTAMSGVMTTDIDYDNGSGVTSAVAAILGEEENKQENENDKKKGKAVSSIVEAKKLSEAEERNPSINLPQLCAIMRTLWPEMAVSEALSFYRHFHFNRKGKVDYEGFLRCADSMHLFSRCLQLCPLALAKIDRKLDQRTHTEIMSMVHMHNTIMTPFFERLKAKLPDMARSSFTALQQQVQQVIELSRKSFSTAKGFCPIYAYRRLLNAALQYRMICYELHSDYASLLLFNSKEEAISNDGQSAEDIENADQQTIDNAQLVKMMSGELEMTARVLLDAGDKTSTSQIEMFSIYDGIKKSLAVMKVQSQWRRKLKTSTANGVPWAIVKYMRRGYILGRDMIKFRQVPYTIEHTQNIIGEIYAFKQKTDESFRRRNLTGLAVTTPFLPTLVEGERKKKFYVTPGLKVGFTSGTDPSQLQPHPFPLTIYLFFLQQYGQACVAERYMHDFFHNVRKYLHLSVRCKVFGYLLGMDETEHTDDIKDVNLLHSEEGVNFVLRILCLCHRDWNGELLEIAPKKKPKKDFLQEEKVKENTSGCFNETGRDASGRPIWAISRSSCFTIAKYIFLKPVFNEDEFSTGYANLIDAIDGIPNATKESEDIDIDEYILTLCRFWCTTIGERYKVANATTLISASKTSNHLLSHIHYKQLENEIFNTVNMKMSLPEGMTDFDMDFMSLEGYYKSLITYDDKGHDPTTVISESVRPKLLIDLKASPKEGLDSFTTCHSYVIDQLMLAYAQYWIKLDDFSIFELEKRKQTSDVDEKNSEALRDITDIDDEIALRKMSATGVVAEEPSVNTTQSVVTSSGKSNKSNISVVTLLTVQTLLAEMDRLLRGSGDRKPPRARSAARRQSAMITPVRYSPSDSYDEDIDGEEHSSKNITLDAARNGWTFFQEILSTMSEILIQKKAPTRDTAFKFVEDENI